MRKNENYQDVALVVAGGKGWLDSGVTDRESLVKDNINPVGFVEDDDLPLLYSGAVGFVYPSIYEGFGFPVLEALSCGTPAIISNTSSLPEVAGNAGIYVDPLSTASMN